MDKRTLSQIFEEKGVDVLFSSSPYTRLWFTKVNSSAGYLFIEPSKATLLIDGRYIEYAKAKAQNTEVILLAGTAFKDFATSKQDTYKKIAIESDYMTIAELTWLKKSFPSAEFVEISGAKLRIIKTKEEADKVKKAAQIALQALAEIKPLIKPGISEKELDAHLEKAIRMLGAEKGSFDAIIASGARGALPHGRASDKILQDGELVTIDFGAIYEGFCSDITRTFHIGNVTDAKLLEIEAVLREAQRLGVAAVKPGIKTHEVDKVCRDYITSKGYGQYFTHSTGHGLGIEVHEAPAVSANETFSVTLEPGMIITVEPGIYLEGFGGIRVEDDVLVTETGHEVLSKI